MKALLTPIFLLILMCSPVTWSADFEKGITALGNGDYATALKEWTPLAEQGNAYAQFNLGSMYANGQGVPQDNKIAFKWYTLAAQQGNSLAQLNLGVMYDKGQGVSQNLRTAVKWYTLAAEQGLATAQFNLGVVYELGQGIPQDNIYAHMWYSIAASNGFDGANQRRDVVAKRMTPADISKSGQLARECVAKDYKGC